MSDMKSPLLSFVDTVILLVSTAGIAVSLALSAWGVSIAPGPLQGPVAEIGKWALLAEFPLLLLFILRLQARDRTAGASQVPDYSGCPPWLRALSYGLMGAGVLLFFYPAVLQFSGIGAVADGSTLPSTMPGGFGLLTNTSIFAQTYSLMVLAQRGQNKPSPTP